MGVYSLGDLVDAIESTLSVAAALERSQSYDELTEGMADYPTLQVYPEENAGTSGFSSTDRISLSGKHSVKEYLIHADLLAHPRAEIGEDMARLVEAIDDLEDILDTQAYPLFGAEYITSFRWSWKRVVFSYAGAEYMGARFFITVRCGSGG